MASIRTDGRAARTPFGGLAGGVGAVSPLRERRAELVVQGGHEVPVLVAGHGWLTSR